MTSYGKCSFYRILDVVFDKNVNDVRVSNDIPNLKDYYSKKYNINFVKAERVKKEKAEHDVYGFPTSSAPSNQVLDVQRYLPIYTKGAKSKSFYCAGYYTVQFNNTWVRAYCPKLITLNRYEFEGPFKTEERMLAAMKERNG